MAILVKERWDDADTFHFERGARDSKTRGYQLSDRRDFAPALQYLAFADRPVETEPLLNCLAPQNQKSAGNAPVLLLTVAKRHFEAGGSVNHYAFHDVGLAVGNLSVEATALGLFVHLMAGFDAAEARKLFAIPETHEPVSVIAVGYFGGLEAFPPGLQQRELAPRKRRPFREFVFSGRWGNPTGLIPD
ncbi:MAG TPA: nitroreductase family protein [Bryobacteraceae bacterium]|nr:nitroreductase family protein [Bryobacteraceae bacterium]